MYCLNAILQRFLVLVFAVIILACLPNLSIAQDTNLPESSAVQSVISDQISAFHAQDVTRAYSHASPAIKKIFPSVDRFIAMVKRGFKPIYNSTGHVFGRNSSLNSDFIQELIISDENEIGRASCRERV